MPKSGVSIWLPVDFYLSVSRSRKRLLEVPTMVFHNGATRAVRFECCILLHLCIIVDFIPVRFNAFSRHKRR